MSRRFTTWADPTYIDAARLVTGDTVVVRPRDKDSLKIAWATSGPFSHAQLVLDKCLVLESTYDTDYAGVRFSILKACYLKRRPRTRLAVINIGEFEYFEVLRYKTETEDEAARLREFRAGLWAPQFPENFGAAASLGVLAELVSRRYAILEPGLIIGHSFPPTLAHGVVGVPYASADTLAKLSQKLSSPPFRALAMAVLSSIIPKNDWEGYFCSQLICSIYRTAGIPLMDIADDEITPNALAECARLDVITESLTVGLTDVEIARIRSGFFPRFYASEIWRRMEEQLHRVIPAREQKEREVTRERLIAEVSAILELLADEARQGRGSVSPNVAGAVYGWATRRFAREAWVVREEFFEELVKCMWEVFPPAIFASDPYPSGDLPWHRIGDGLIAEPSPSCVPESGRWRANVLVFQRGDTQWLATVIEGPDTNTYESFDSAAWASRSLVEK